MEDITNEKKETDLENPELKKEIEIDSDLKKFLVSYTGDKLDPKDNQVTTEMIIQVMAEDFPEFLLAVAEENWIRGYRQALLDIEEGEKLMDDEENDTNQPIHNQQAN